MAGAQQSVAHQGSLVYLLPVMLFVHLPTHAHVLQYDRVDPTEFQSLKDEVESLRAEKLTREAQQATHAEQLTG
jgi:hypothetical protein